MFLTDPNCFLKGLPMYTSMNQICTHFQTFKNNSPLFWRYLCSEVLKNKKIPDLKMITGTKILTLSTLFCPPLSKRFPGKILVYKGFPCGSDGKESARNAGDLGSIPGLGRSPGEGHDDPLQYSCLENPMNRGAWQAMVHGDTKSQT